MNAPPSRPAARPARVLDAFTEQDVCNYAHHLWIQSGMSFDGDPWAEARACLAANLPADSAAQARTPRLKPPLGGSRRVDFAAGIPS